MTNEDALRVNTIMAEKDRQITAANNLNCLLRADIAVLTEQISAEKKRFADFVMASQSANVPQQAGPFADITPIAVEASVEKKRRKPRRRSA